MEIFLLILFCLGFIIQIFLFLGLFTRILLHTDTKKNSYKSVSIIVAAHNEKKNLLNLVPSLLNQLYNEFEVIIVNDRSTDGSTDFLNSFSNNKLKIINIEYVPPQVNPKKYALQRGIETAKNEVILLTDADCLSVSENWVDRMQSNFTEEIEIVLGYSPYKVQKGFLNLFIRYETFLAAVQYLSFSLIGFPYMGVGRNLAYLKTTFINSGGFNETLSITGGDDDLLVGKMANRSNTAICMDKSAQVTSIPKNSWKRFFRQKLRHLGVGKKYAAGHKIKSGLFPVSQILLYFSSIFLFIINFNISIILTIFILRTLVLIVIFALITRKLRDTIEWFWFPVLDLFYAVYYLITGISAILSTNIKWK